MCPGLRVPGAWGPFEVAVHAVLAQHHRRTEARPRIGELVRALGIPVPGLGNGLTHLFPFVAALYQMFATLAAITLITAWQVAAGIGAAVVWAAWTSAATSSVV